MENIDFNFLSIIYTGLISSVFFIASIYVLISNRGREVIKKEDRLIELFSFFGAISFLISIVYSVIHLIKYPFFELPILGNIKLDIQMIFFLFGLLFFLLKIALLGWSRSPKLGRIISIVLFVAFLILIYSIN